MARKNVNTTLDIDLYNTIRKIAFDTEGINANDLIEEGMEYIIKKYGYEITVQNTTKKD